MDTTYRVYYPSLHDAGYDLEDGGREEVMEVLKSRNGIMDVSDNTLYIANLVYNDAGDACIVDGVSYLTFDAVDMAERGVWDALADPVGWSLANVPAAGSCSPDRMGWLDTEDMIAEVMEHPQDFRDVHQGFFVSVPPCGTKTILNMDSERVVI